ncbi:NADH-quinone oxidoreductase subunit C [SCandidatus Aminicenantes bacterium Aminicenantia_JdfR_composite]|jgi:NADH-quinone oxidoreductase subunit C|nr:NADH-quinone oxidoreductase subunit C [SCandidatus Aminicenantes bacterium Aminicenantia_JdfR_composite]MCP2596755.1 NADH-quinone oxidoreductase subunit C [Candidatus Aminicenantes bacterium AC-335-G13]MCP2620447.1 NADH-quinone oxidoreductase subunit C [Candidatus Aminicenantes bacterium AC-334-E05]
MKESKTIKILKEKFPKDILKFSAPFGDETLLIKKDSLIKIMKFLKENPELGYSLLLDITCVDYLGEKPRFELIYHIYSFRLNHRLRIKTRIDEKNPITESVISLWKNANWLEREVYDMFGIKFKNHPDLRRILMYDEFEGYPLRKDYPLRKRQPRLPGLE